MASWLFFRYSLLVSLVASSLMACATLPPAQPARDVKNIAGKWEGSLTSRSGNLPITLTIKEDGTWESIVPALSNPGPRFEGTVAVADGKFRWKSITSGRTGTYTLHEGDGKRVLVTSADDGSSVGELRPAK
jgi:hypothetical protein